MQVALYEPVGWSRSAEGVADRVEAPVVRPAPQDPPALLAPAVRVDLAGCVGLRGLGQARLVAVEDPRAARPAVAVSAAGPCDVEEC
ncbi:hypothetical protein FHU38_004532 [Saccharomonospora amisosensis]|uniref:Uncharacterized protein n=1 Tax=Saccharomonospora amisosensis TaxID=1128677 RepID=A0A7X5UUY8_9PSEU|nr:hypothetical protein [Saccharomonospora amisosensis]